MYLLFFWLAIISLLILVGIFAYLWNPFIWIEAFIAAIVLLGLHDISQRRNLLLRNYPVLGHFRPILLFFRSYFRQYFIEPNVGGDVPFDHETRELIYERASGKDATVSFGSSRDHSKSDYEWINHSIRSKPALALDRVLIGGETCKQPYKSSRLNISAMGFGPLSANAILAMNLAVKHGKFAQNTGEDGISPYHLKYGGDLIWQIGTGYFGCRNSEGRFDPGKFAEIALLDNIKMIEIKLSQGAKPGLGGLLPGKKVTKEIARLYGVPLGQPIVTPPSHAEFKTPVELLGFVNQLRELSHGKPVGIKICVGSPREFIAICKAMAKTDILLDYIQIDGSEGGTAAAPWELSNHVGMPLYDGLVFAHNILVGMNLRNKILLMCSGKIATGFDIFRAISLGTDICCSARAILISLGCIQTRICHTDKCPVGIATQNPARTRAIDVKTKALAIASYHKLTLDSFARLVGVAGLESATEIGPYHVFKRNKDGITRNFGQIYNFIEPGSLLNSKPPDFFREDWVNSSANSF